MELFCSNCGTKSKENDKFCNECGFPLKKEENKNTQITEDKKANSFINIVPPNNKLSDISKTPNNTNINIPTNGNYKSNYQENNQTKKTIKKLITIFTVILLLLTATIVFINRERIFNSMQSKRTIMIYMVGSNLESKYSAASIDINEMINSGANFENINLLIYTGGAKKWHNEEVPNDKNAIFKVTENGIEKLEEYKITDMGDSETLTNFLNYGFTNFKAGNYSLILWDHGGGPIYGYGEDEHNKTNSLTLLELKKALAKSDFDATNKLEFIGFDACLMSTAEIAFVLSDYAEYMIASQELEPGDGWNYKFLKELKTTSTTNSIGKTIIDYYSDYYNNKLNGKGISLSLLKLNKMDSFEQKLNALFEDIDENLLIEFSNISRSRSISKTFGKNSASGYDLVDLYDLVEKLPSKYYDKVDAVKSAIKDLVVYQKTDLINTNGISIYFPYENKKQIKDIMYLYETFNFAESYTNFISNFSSRLTGTRLHNWTLTENVPTSDDEGKISVSVPNEVIENYSSASYIIFEKIDEDYYMPIYKGTDVTVDNNSISTTMSNKALVATASNGDKIYVTALEAEKGKDYTKYIIPGMLQNWGENFISDFEILPIYLQLVVNEEHPNGIVAGALPLVDEETQVSPKLIIDIKEWKIIQLLNYKYKIFDEEGIYTSDWTGSGEVTGIESDTTEGFNLQFENLDISKDYYCLFRITDSQGNIYTTNIVKVRD